MGEDLVFCCVRYHEDLMKGAFCHIKWERMHILMINSMSAGCMRMNR